MERRKKLWRVTQNYKQTCSNPLINCADPQGTVRRLLPGKTASDPDPRAAREPAFGVSADSGLACPWGRVSNRSHGYF